mmetsp:Transcript_23874/g.50617  ORF Transcript_23874/g.50617 Transcript_23874/m.50617 type:complete len:95 (-) Transcript_23874:245-529(-)
MECFSTKLQRRMMERGLNTAQSIAGVTSEYKRQAFASNPARWPVWACVGSKQVSGNLISAFVSNSSEKIIRVVIYVYQGILTNDADTEEEFICG